MLETFDEARLAAGDSLGDALEANRIVHFPRCPFPLPADEDLAFLRNELPRLIRNKNVSYHPEAGAVRGMDDRPELRARVGDILTAHRAAVTGFLSGRMPELTRDWRVGTTSFRPIQEKGRNLKPHASNELVHIDAGAYGATDGDRIFRFFVNVNPDEDRVWATRGSFDDVLERWGREAGLLDGGGRLAVRVDKGPMDHAFSGLIGALSRLNPMARVLDSSPYDRAMRRLHNFMKDSGAFHRDRHGHEEFRFAPGSAWMVFTDGVSHASLSGQYAFVTTCIVPRANLQHPERSPYARLRAHAERASSSTSS